MVSTTLVPERADDLPTSVGKVTSILTTCAGNGCGELPMADIEVQGRPFLLVGVGGGTAVHLAPDGARHRRETCTTLCGRDWAQRVENPEAVPTCRRCLASIDRFFPNPSRDIRVDLIAQLVVEALHEHGVAEVIGVPGDQMSALRTAVRKAVKSRFGYKLNTHVLGGRLIIDCPDAFAPHADAHMQNVAQRMNTLFNDEDGSTINDSGWRLDWAMWSVQ